MGELLILLVLGIVGARIRTFWKKRESPRFVRVAWSNTIRLPLPAQHAMSAVVDLLAGEHRCRLVGQEPAGQIFTRGNYTITELPIERDVPWLEIPIFIHVEYGVEGAETVVAVGFRAPQELILSEAAADTFRECAAGEFQAIFKRLDACLREYQAAPEGNEAADEVGAYAALNLKPGASWAQVQAAYREACKRYHPDTLSGQNVPPHLIELAVKHFEEVSEAYQRLRERLASCHRG